MMTDLKILTIKNSWSYIIFNPEEVSLLFYTKLFELDPSLQLLFKGKTEEQGKKLMSILTMFIAKLQKLPDIETQIKALGQRHIKYGVQVEHYHVAGKALLWTLEKVLGSRWNQEVSDAWEEVYSMIISTMLEGVNTDTESQVVHFNNVKTETASKL